MNDKTHNDIPKAYDPTSVEDKWYKHWEEKKYFAPTGSGNPFCIVIPPPNVTGALHMGHALDETLQDILIRYHRMRGYSTLWVPGTDHAGIATQNVVEKQLKAEGTDRHKLGREKFIERVWKWKDEYGNRITQQLRHLGASCDWDRERFTMDEGCSKAVREVFISLYEEGLIYRGHRIINWCPRCHTALSDIEVPYVETKGSLWHFKYPFSENPKEGVIVATTRPETMLGDTAVAVHPKDKRYKTLIGKTVRLPIANKEIPIIADELVDKDFGTGAVKVTPGHDPNDYEMSLRHKMEPIIIMDEKAVLNKNVPPSYQGLNRFKARELIIKQMKEEGFLVDIEDYQHNVGHCYRCNEVVEPYLSEQWFVNMKPLAEKAIQVVKDKKIEFVPERWTKVYLDWMENIRDWCISRQIWWGHRIPVWYCECGEIIVSREDPKSCPKCKKNTLRQDNDVLDTWFSSALWPFSTLGWPEKTDDLKKYYPTSALVTGYDII
ncbi:valine--tRNA ligase, partial [Candidatus Margulisiibacteriota bacterium]